MTCLTSPFRQLYDNFINRCFLGAVDVWFLPHESIEERNKCVTTGYAVNKDPLDLVNNKCCSKGFQYQVLDHIGIIGEILSGIYKTENKEFNQIVHIFLREFMMSDIFILYSKKFKEYELELAKKLSIENQEDPVLRLEKSYPDCNFRLLRRVPAKTEDNKIRYRWDAVLSGVQDIELLDEFLPKINKHVKNPLRFSFNDGQLFMRLYQIFAQYEAQMQTYKRLFNTLHKVGDINGEDQKSINTKQIQFESPTVFTTTTLNHKDSTVTVQNLELINQITALKESYDNITTLLNDSLGRLGLAGDDSTKAERVTTGENFRALQPNMAFQQAVLNRLEYVTERLRIHFKQEVEFTPGMEPNEQGIPINEELAKPDTKIDNGSN